MQDGNTLANPADNLNEQQKRFCEAYVVDWNATQAYLKAYPNSGYDAARSSAVRMLTNANVAAYIEDCKKRTAELAGISALKVALEHKKIAFQSAANLRQDWDTVKEWDSLTDEEKAIISEIEVTEKVLNGGDEDLQVLERKLKYKTYDKHKSLDALAKMLGFNEPERLNVSGNINFTLPSGKDEDDGKSDPIE